MGVAERIILSRKEGLRSPAGARAFEACGTRDLLARRIRSSGILTLEREEKCIYGGARPRHTHGNPDKDVKVTARSGEKTGEPTREGLRCSKNRSRRLKRPSGFARARASAEDGTGVTVILPALFDVLLCSLIDWFDLLSMKIHNVRLGHFCARLNGVQIGWGERLYPFAN